MDTALSYTLMAQDTCDLGNPITIEFVIQNLSSREVWILKWYTPLEGIKGKIFEIKCDGVEMQYEGRFVKRGNPTKDDYVFLLPDLSVQVEVDLSQAYSLRKCKECQVTFKGRIHDVVFDEHQVPRASDQQHPITIPGNTVSFQIV